MKILHIALSLSPASGGPPKVIQGLSEALLEKGNEVFVFSSMKNRGEDLIFPKNVTVKTFSKSFFSRIWKGHSFSLKKELEKKISNFDIIHIHETWHYPHFIAYKLAKKFKKPFVVTPHGTFDLWCLNYKGVKKKIFKFLIQGKILREASFVQALTENELIDIKSFEKNSNIKVIPNGINIKDFGSNSPSQILIKKYPHLENKKIILFLGRIHPIKGLDLLINSFSSIAEKNKDIHLLIVGPDENNYQKQIEKIIKEKNSQKTITFTGPLVGKEKEEALNMSSVFVLPSYSEGFSMTVLEAMASKLPVIITHQCNFPEISENNAGIAINPKVEELTEAMIKLLKNPLLAQEMGRNGKKLVEEKYTWEKIANQMTNLYENAIILKKQK
jgi:glycosyltransferase involved in cell wall biosynthesis